MSQKGAALLVALLMAVVLGALAAGLIAVTVTDTLISGAHRTAHETSYAAEAALERAISDLATITDWSAVLAPAPGHLTSTLMDGQYSPVGPDGRRLEPASLTVGRQRDSDTRDGAFLGAADSPRWQLYLQGPLDAMPVAASGPAAYLFVWAADDGDGDGDPYRDANGCIVLHADAYGTGGARRAVEAAVRRRAPGIVEVLSRRFVR